VHVIIIMGSPSDRGFASQITEALDALGIPWVVRISSAHKTPRALLDMLAVYEAEPGPHVYVTVAGRSNALSGMVDAAVAAPVIACPPPSEAFGGADRRLLIAPGAIGGRPGCRPRPEERRAPGGEDARARRARDRGAGARPPG